MITRILFYILESGVLAGVIAGGVLPVVKRALKTLGYELRLRLLRALLIVWALFLLAGIIGGELVGPTFLLVYRIVGLAVVMALSFLVFAPLLSRHIRVDRADATTPAGATPGPSSAVGTSHDGA